MVGKELKEKDKQIKEMREQLISMDAQVLAANARASDLQYQVHTVDLSVPTCVV